MTQFETAFKQAVRRAGFKPVKSLVDKRAHNGRPTFVKLYQSPTGSRFRLQDAVVQAVRRG